VIWATLRPNHSPKSIAIYDVIMLKRPGKPDKAIRHFRLLCELF
jgi:hypothetical protein